MWKRFKRHKAGVVGLIVFIFILVLVVFAEFFAPYGQSQVTNYYNAPPQKIHFIDEGGNWHLPFVYERKSTFDLNTGVMEWTEDTGRRLPISLFVRGEPYFLFGKMRYLHFFGVEGGYVFLFGTNYIGQDVFSRLLYGGRVSLFIALITMIITLVSGTVVGLISGYFKGVIDLVAQRIIELFMIVPSVPLALALAAFLPADMDAHLLMLGIAVVLSITSWGNVARQVRGKTLTLREGIHVRAAVSLGASAPRILLRHILPSLYSHLIVLATLTIPQTIIAESGLSYLGFGVRSPYTSWGQLLQEAQNFRVIALHPWIMIPGIAIIVAVIALNLIGDALRDAADPYMR